MKQKKTARPSPAIFGEGRDELNLAEFPIAILASRPDKNLKTVHFEDRTWDKGQNTWVPRRLTISASDQYGLPTALDDEIVLGLIQLTREDGFLSRKVFFSRYRLLKNLGWRTEGKSYLRLETSLKRWLGVTFYYQNAWWDKRRQIWVDENFHLLEQVSLWDRKRRAAAAGLGEPSLSLFVWNEVIFRSFQAGYLKQIDMALFRRLQSPIAKRLYRLLDKRFYHKPAWEFDLKELACEHVGLSRGYDMGQLKRKLRPAIAELVAVGYLEPMEDNARFLRGKDACWQVSFAKSGDHRQRNETESLQGQVGQQLIAQGVSSTMAARLVAEFSVEEIQRRIAVVEWLRSRPDGAAPKNPAGYLIASLRQGFDLPAGFPEAGERNVHRRSSGACSRSGRRQSQRGESGVEATGEHVDHLIRSLSPAERERLEARALATAAPSLKAAYQRVVQEQSPLLEDVYRRLMLEHYLARGRKRQ